MKKLITAATLAACLWPSGVLATELEGLPPNSTDLQASYCVGLFDAEKKSVMSLPEGSLRDMTMESTSYREQEAARLRIGSYIAPRVKFLDSAGLLAAKAQGEKDFAEMMAGYKVCTAPCKEIKCLTKCVDGRPHKGRVDKCVKAEFLPY